MKKTKLLKTIGITSTIGLAVVPITISTVSCTSGDKIPEQPLVADTSAITSFVDAIKFTKKYLQKNYNFEMLKNDINNYAKLISENFDTNNGEKVEIKYMNFSHNKDNTINFTWEMNFDDNENKNKYVCMCKNFQLTPVLIKTNENELKLGFYLPNPHPPYSPYSLVSSEQPQLDLTGDKIVGAKHDFKIYENDKLVQNLGWTKTLKPTINEQKIYIIDYKKPWNVGYNCFLSSTIDLTFNKINDINENLFNEE